MTIVEAMRDRALFGPWFKGRTWGAWFAFLAALYGLGLDESALETFRACTGRSTPPPEAFREAWVIAGRRGGKTLIAAVLAVYVAAFRNFRQHLAPGEQAVVMLLAADRKQARVAFRYVRGFVREIPMLRAMVENETAERIEFTNGSVVEIHTSNFKSVRGYSAAAVIADEVAFWPADEASASSDVETINALRPALANLPGSLLIGISSPYARRGVLWQQHRAHFGKDDSRVLVWKAPTRRMNPGIDERIIDEAYEADPAAASAEYGAEFRSDVESFVAREAVESCVIPGRHELPPVPGVSYVAHMDPSGGGADSFTLAIGHREQGRTVIDCLRERKPPFRPQDVVEEYAAELKRYGCRRVTGDRYAAEWCASAVRAAGILYHHCEKPRSDLYRELLPVLNAGEVELLDHPKLIAQICGLERRAGRGGRDSIDHAPNSHDDLANVVAGIVARPGREPGDLGITF